MKKKPAPPPLTEVQLVSRDLGSIIASQMCLEQIKNGNNVSASELFRIKTMLAGIEIKLQDRMKELDPKFKEIPWRDWSNHKII